MIPFVDTHHHLWDFDRFSPHWLEPGSPSGSALIEDYEPIRKPYLISDLLADFSGSNVVKSVHIQTGYTDIDPVEETAWLQTIADEHEYPHAIIAYSDLRSATAEKDLERHMEHDNMRGVRNFVQGQALLDASFQRGLMALTELDLIYDLSTTWEGMPEARQMADRNPQLQIVLGHAGMPAERTHEYFDVWSRSLRELAAAPNVAVKISGLGLADHSWTIDSIRPWVTKVIELFGVGRCMFGTNWPVDKLFSSYKDLVEAYRSIISDFSFGERTALLSKNAEHIYRI